jgi:hypothetical protein
MKDEAKRKAEREKDTKDSKKEEEKQEDGDKEKSDKQTPLPGNGGYTDKYRWAQTLEECTVYIPLPDNVASRNLDVKFTATKLKVGLKG